jgi:hypothetical protein
MPSWCIKDYDLRVRYHDGGVVHAAYKHTIGPYKTWRGLGSGGMEEKPAREVVAIACKRVGFSNPGVNEEHLVSNKNEITCKNCLRVMGVITPKTTSARYVVVDTKTGMYLKRGRGFCKDPWVEDVLDATIYRSKPAAIHQTKRYRYFDGNDNEMTHKEFYSHGHATGNEKRRELGWYSKYGPHPRYEVKEVKITIE